MYKKRLKLDFDPEIVDKPLTYNIIKEYDVVVNIIQARILPDEEGQLIIDLMSEDSAKVKNSIKHLMDLGVEVKVVENTIVFNDALCINCGACTGVCKTGALTMDQDSWELLVNQEKCHLCGMCLSACYVNAISLEKVDVDV